MRLIQYQRLVPSPSAQQHETDLLAFLRTEAYLATFLNCDKQLPHIEELNRILASGSGDDGHFVMKWNPFTITEAEYGELAKEFGKSE